jgi:cysteinyl-tRNA synthetase
MSLRLHDTLSDQKLPFETAQPGHARIYVCGPTVYDYAHLGHVRCYVVYDVLVRHLRATGTRVTYVRNITDIDDKILARAKERGEAPTELAARFAEAFHQDLARVGNLRPDIEPKVSEHLDEIRDLVARLIEGGHAYEAGGDVYFDVHSFKDYGKLSHRNLADLEAGASGRTAGDDTGKKRHPADFALWKGAAEGEVSWESPWGAGRPGWHIECSAMSMAHLGESFDLHGGGLDLVFPHHENEVAQSEAATGKPFATTWMHNGFVEVDKTKMSKSLGNCFTARDVYERVEPEAIRYFTMTVHYRAPLSLDWTLDDDGQVTGFPQFEEAERRVEYVYQTRQRLEEIPESRIAEDGTAPESLNLRAGLVRTLDDDLNMPQALAQLAEFLKSVNELCDAAGRKKGKAPKASVMLARDGFAALEAELGLGVEEPRAILERIRDRRAAARGIEPGDVEERIEERRQARADKDFARADEVRDALTALGVELHDSPHGTRWTMR